MTTLHELFSAESEHATARAAGAVLPPAIEQHVRTRVGAAHTRRAAGVTVLATLAVVAAGVGVMLGIQAWGPQGPAVTPPTTGSTHPSPSPDASEPTTTSGLGVLPVVEPAPAGILDVATLGWSLSTYVPASGGEQQVYLVSDTGRVYGLTTLPATPVVEFVAWRPGLSYAVVRVIDVTGGDRVFRDLEVLDLATGELRASNSPWAGADGTMGPLTEGGTLTVTSGTAEDIAWDENGPVATVAHPPLSDAPWAVAEAAIAQGPGAGAAMGPLLPVAVPDGVVYTTTPHPGGLCADSVWHAAGSGAPIDLTAGLRAAVPSVETFSSLAVAGDWAYVRFGGACADHGPGGLARLSLDGLTWRVLIAPPTLALDAVDQGVTSIITAMPGQSLR